MINREIIWHYADIAVFKTGRAFLRLRGKLKVLTRLWNVYVQGLVLQLSSVLSIRRNMVKTRNMMRNEVQEAELRLTYTRLHRGKANG